MKNTTRSECLPADGGDDSDGRAWRGHRGTGRVSRRSLPPWQHRRNSHCFTKRGQAFGHRDWRAERRQHGVHHRHAAQCDVIRYLRDDPGRYVDGHWTSNTHSYSRRASGRIHDTRGPDDHRGIGQIRRSYRLDDVRWTEPQRLGRCRCGNRRSGLSGLRLRSKYQSQRKLSPSSIRCTKDASRHKQAFGIEWRSHSH